LDSSLLCLLPPNRCEDTAIVDRYLTLFLL
jgi:hypothetical protein